MLNLITGRARSGKTTYVMDAIKKSMNEKRSGNILLVPEQYSHASARALAKHCGDSLSLYGEVVTFSLLADRVFAETGGLAQTLLDEGGRLLVMSLAFASVQSQLHVYGGVAEKSEFLTGLLKAHDELKSCRVAPALLAEQETEGTLAGKLHDLSLICGAFDAILGNDLQDPVTRLEKLADGIGKSSVGNEGQVYIDGFSDFTAQEMRVIGELLKKGADVTVTIQTGGSEDAFAVAEHTRFRLLRLAGSLGVDCRTQALDVIEGTAAPELEFLEKTLFKTESGAFEGEGGAVKIIAADSPASECEIAAAELIRLVRDEGYRWRELAVAARGFEAYEPLIDSIFSHYGVPAFLNRKSDILQKPVLSLVTSAMDAVSSGFDYESMFRYLKTGLAGLTPDECDELENYVLKWNIRGVRLWSREEPWTFNPRGYVSESTDEDAAKLERLNLLRKTAALPLERYSVSSREAGTAAGQVRALYSLMEDIGLAERLTEKTEQFRETGRIKTAEEYSQLWDILVKVMEQCDTILGELPMSADEFTRLFKLVLSSYDVATIPVSLDAVTAGDMTRMRSGQIKCLIVLGATDDALPMISDGSGILTDTEREKLTELGLELTGGTEERILREMQMMYACLTMPTRRLTFMYPKMAGGAKKRPSYIISRVQALLGLQAVSESELEEDFRTSAEAPCFELAVSGGGTRAAAAARAYFTSEPTGKERLSRILEAAGAGRGTLSERAVEGIYGKKLRLSASRVDRFYSCKFSYFIQYGLKAKPRTAAGLDAPEIGTFLHFVLENVISELREGKKLKTADSAERREITARWIAKYVSERLGGMEEKSGRFKYLFTRLVKDVYSIVEDMADELKSSQFVPMNFELEFGGDGLPPATVSGGSMDITVGGFVDRVDGWLHDGKLYLRVIDYKTGKKSFDLSDVWYGMGMQMLIYLFTLAKHGAEFYKEEIVPAGVLYAPARDVFLSMPRSATEEDIRAERSKSLMRSGLILNDSDVIEAMETGEKKYLPLKLSKDGTFKPDNLATLEQLGKLGAHIEKTLRKIGDELKRGSISADPFVRGGMSPCDYCDFREACLFDEGCDKKRYLKHKKPQEVWNDIEGGGQNG